MRRRVFTKDHEAFRTTVRDFIAEQVAPHYADWERQGHVPRELYRKLGDLGVFGINVPEEYGGAGVTDFTYQTVIREECGRAGVGFGAESVHTCLVLPYLLEFGSEEQKKRWLPGFLSGETMTAIAMTEPGTGLTSPASPRAPGSPTTGRTTSSTEPRRSSPAARRPT